jgi:hypothetical protein
MVHEALRTLNPGTGDPGGHGLTRDRWRQSSAPRPSSASSTPPSSSGSPRASTARASPPHRSGRGTATNRASASPTSSPAAQRALTPLDVLDPRRSLGNLRKPGRSPAWPRSSRFRRAA